MGTLYKYVSAERTQTCLPEVGDGTLRVTQPSALNDPFECAVWNTYVKPSMRASNKELSDTLTSLNRTSRVSEEDVCKARKKYGSLYLRQLIARQLSQRFGIVSFSSNPLHPLMWAHYSSDGTGFAVGYDREQLKTLGKNKHCLRKVLYRSEPARILEHAVPRQEAAYRLLSLKSDHWEYEKEWRLILELKQTIQNGNCDDRHEQINVIHIPNRAVRSLYYTERTSLRKLEELCNRLRGQNNNYKDVNLIQLRMSESRYGYEECLRDVISSECSV